MAEKRLRVRFLGLFAALAVMMVACAGETADTTTAGTAPPETTGTTAGEEEPTTTAGEEPADDTPIVIGALTSLTGNFTPWGLQVVDGMQLAVDEINAAGGVDGRMLELVVADDQSTAEEGVSGFERLVEQDGVIAVGGIISSDVGVNTALVAEELQIPTFLVKAGSPAILTQDSRYTFRTCLPSAPMVAGPILQYAQSEGLIRVGAIIADYAWGQAINAALTDTFEGSGIELQVEVAPVPETDFTTYLRALEGFEPEMIVATGHPPGSAPITVQSADLGLDVPITGAYTPKSLVMGGVAEAAIGRYADFGCADYNSDDYQDLARRYLAMSDNVFLEDDAVAGFGIVTMVADAVGEVGDDPVAIAEYLHGKTYDLPGFSFEMVCYYFGELSSF
ncbi:MAG: ABC transporter substrate-binding protein [Actinomycetota bacterium]|nr:ABC transporter substrate-binding protein [Actinomycetota bacterium]